MPTYVYKAMTKNGQIVKNRITESSKINCIRKLKRNELIPISVVQTLRTKKDIKKKPRNLKRMDPNLREIGTRIAKDKTTTSRKRIKRKSIVKIIK